MNYRYFASQFVITFLILKSTLVNRANCYPSENINPTSQSTLDVKETKVELTTVGQSLMEKYASVNNKNESTVVDDKTDLAKQSGVSSWIPKGFLNWIYPNPSTLKQAFYRWFFDGIIYAGGFMQYDVIKRQILVTLGKLLTQWKKDRAQRQEEREQYEEMYKYNNYNQPYGYQNPEDYHSPAGYEIVDQEAPENQGSQEESYGAPISGLSSYSHYDNQILQKRQQDLRTENNYNSKISTSDVLQRLFGVNDKICFQRTLCELENMSSYSPTMANLLQEIRRYFSLTDQSDPTDYEAKVRNCNEEFSECKASSYEILKYILN